MIFHKHLVAGLVAGATALALSGDLRAQSDDADKAADKKVLAAIVNGTEIYQDQVRAMMDLVPAEYKQAPYELLYPMLLQAVVSREVMAIKARDGKLHESDDFKRRMGQFEQQLLQSIYMEIEVQKALTDERVQEAYEAFKKSVPAEEEVHARHILLKTEEEAKAVIETLKGGKDFAELAKEKSTGPSGPEGGDLGYFTKATMVPEFGEAAFAMKPGDVSETPVKTQFGWHVIKVEDKRQKQPPALEQVEEQLRQQLAQQIGGEIMDAAISDSDVKLFDLKGNEMADEKEPAAEEGKEQTEEMKEEEKKE